MDNNPKKEIERLSKENFNLKLRLHHYEQQQGFNPSDDDFDRRISEDQERQINYRLLLEEAKTVVAGLQDDVSSAKTRGDRLDSENRRMKYELERMQERLREEEESRIAAEEINRRQRADFETAIALAEADRAAEVTDLRDRLREEQEGRRIAEEDSRRLRSDLEYLENEKRTGAWQTVSLQNQLVKAEEDARQWKQQLDRLENEKRKGEWQTSHSSDEIARLEAEGRRWRYEAEKLEAERRRGDWRSTSSLELTKAEEEARRWRLEAERLEAEKRNGGWEQKAASEMRRAEEEARKWKSECERLEYEIKKGNGWRVSGAEEELTKWQTFAESATGLPGGDITEFVAHFRGLERQARRKVDDSKTWEIFAESLTGSRTIEALEAYIRDLEARFERLAHRVEIQQQKKPASLQRVHQAEEKLKAATERLERLEGSRRGRMEEYIQRINDLEDENRRLLRELTELKMSKASAVTLARGAPRTQLPVRRATPGPTLDSGPVRRGSHSRVNEVALGAIRDLDYAASLLRKEGR